MQVSPFLQQMFMPLLHAIFEVLLRPAEDNDQSAALEKQMLRRSYFAFLQTVTGSGMSEVIANQGRVCARPPAVQCVRIIKVNSKHWPATVVQACNPRYLGG